MGLCRVPSGDKYTECCRDECGVVFLSRQCHGDKDTGHYRNTLSVEKSECKDNEGNSVQYGNCNEKQFNGDKDTVRYVNGSKRSVEQSEKGFEYKVEDREGNSVQSANNLDSVERCSEKYNSPGDNECCDRECNGNCDELQCQHCKKGAYKREDPECAVDNSKLSECNGNCVDSETEDSESETADSLSDSESPSVTSGVGTVIHGSVSSRDVTSLDEEVKEKSRKTACVVT